MSFAKRFIASSIGKKQVLGVTGIFLILFLLAHLVGNFLIFAGPETFNGYSYKLITNPLIIPAEAILAAIFAGHAVLAIVLTIENRAARGPVGYALVRTRGRPSRRSFASQWMMVTGTWTLVFLVLHIQSFKFGAYYEATYAGVAMRDLHRLVIETFHRPGYVAWYVASMLVLGLHLHHGMTSVLETLGLDHPRWTPMLLVLGKVVAWAIALGYVSIPVLIYVANAGAPRP